ncbi:hypothetical protein ABOM_002191 [Aspergillus bombycis]|uniref:Uncharacterized protein n=1 Tax=Aspergillus bombycis TaxID=109264 RepID=A0A1F8AA94_9EURO|nr:hypothetical protein ABOM_002191 [Aspergillus bombycis]OGM48309.1 hypothetical protein ABOM_002191 [Aspergillus bombycis]
MNPSSAIKRIIEQGLRDYTRKKAKHSMRTNSIQLKRLGIPLRLDIPDFRVTEILTPLDQEGQPSENNTGILDVFYSHLKYRYSTPSQDNGDELSILRQCISEVRTIALLFPDIRATHIRTCMAAWLGTLCSTDDIIEDMMPDEATAVLNHSIQVLREEFGLEKDIQEEEQMNAVIVNAAQIGGQNTCAGEDTTLQVATNNICALHNHLMGRVLERHANIQQRAIGMPEHALECGLADMQLMITETHLKWCTSAKRYTLTPELHMI